MDADCPAVVVSARVERAPVDMIWVVDNSASMQVAIDQVSRGLAHFADQVAASGLDYRVIMLSLRSSSNPVRIGSSDRFGVCVTPPLAGDEWCGDGERFFHINADIRSVEPLEQLLGTLAQTSGYGPEDARGSEPWAHLLRPEATKSIIVVSDDNSRLSPDDFERFSGGGNPFGETTLPPGLFDRSWERTFHDYLFHALYGYGDAGDRGDRCVYSDGSSPPSGGPTYTTLVQRTGGVRAPICTGADAWRPFFNQVATSVVRSARRDCRIAIPTPPEEMMFVPDMLNVVLRSTGEEQTLPRVEHLDACGFSGGWYYDDASSPTEVSLCPESCDQAVHAIRYYGASLLVEFGCDSLFI
jgi:hypothetical protein